MTSHAVLTVVLLASVSADAQAQSTCTANAGGGAADGPAITFERVADIATAIVEATVQSVSRDPPPTGPGSPIRRDHAVLLATRVIKGPDSVRLFTVSQLGAAGLFEIRPGQRFIVFLNPVDPRLPAPPERPDLPRYGLAAGGRSLLCIGDGRVWVNPSGKPFARFDGVELEKAVADIQSYLKLAEIRNP
jgi:hypothetical protein